MSVYIVVISTDIYGFPLEQRIFSSEPVAHNFAVWVRNNHEEKGHRNFSVDDPEEYVVEDSF